MSKLYAAVFDVSPSEQIGGGEPKVMAMVIGLHSRLSLEQVGSSWLVENQCLTLRKWSGSNDGYKRRFVDHAGILKNSGRVVFGAYVSDDAAIAATGLETWARAMGPLQRPSSHNKKGKPRVLLGGYRVDGVEVDPFEVLVDDLAVLGWYAENIGSLVAALDHVSGEAVKLEVLVDRLPNEQGGDRFHKATLLKAVLDIITRGRGKVMGVPEFPDGSQRELLVDNLAGARREAEEGGSALDGVAVRGLFGMGRTSCRDSITE
jgi:hypothetical protein